MRLLTEILDPNGLDPESRLAKELAKWRAGGSLDLGLIVTIGGG